MSVKQQDKTGKLKTDGKMTEMHEDPAFDSYLAKRLKQLYGSGVEEPLPPGLQDIIKRFASKTGKPPRS